MECYKMCLVIGPSTKQESTCTCISLDSASCRSSAALSRVTSCSASSRCISERFRSVMSSALVLHASVPPRNQPRLLATHSNYITADCKHYTVHWCASIISTTSAQKTSSTAATFVPLWNGKHVFHFYSPGVATDRFSVFCYLLITYDLT